MSSGIGKVVRMVGVTSGCYHSTKLTLSYNHPVDRYSVWIQAARQSDRGFESQYRQEFSLLHVVHTGSGAHPATYPMGTGGSLRRGKEDGARNLLLISKYCRGQANVNLYIRILCGYLNTCYSWLSL
jgi:hypothetical protein